MSELKLRPPVPSTRSARPILHDAGERLGVQTGATDEYANAVTIQPDGNILVAGEATVSPAVTDFLVVRYTPRGGTDQAFNGQGYNAVTISGGADFANGLALQPDGKILVGGQITTSANSSAPFPVGAEASRA